MVFDFDISAIEKQRKLSSLETQPKTSEELNNDNDITMENDDTFVTVNETQSEEDSDVEIMDEEYDDNFVTLPGLNDDKDDIESNNDIIEENGANENQDEESDHEMTEEYDDTFVTITNDDSVNQTMDSDNGKEENYQLEGE